MAGYNTIRGLRVKYLSADPANVEAGQVWYNSTTGLLKVNAQGTNNTWASGGNYPTVVSNIQSAGTQTAGLAFGGVTQNSPQIVTTLTSSYNGTSWTGLSAPSNLGTAIQWGGGCGTQTAALCFSGNGPGQPGSGSVISQAWNGSAWTGTPNMNTARMADAGCGTSTAALCAGGYNPPGSPASVNATEEYNGSSWSSVNNINTTRGYVVGNGLQTAAVIYGGYDWGGPGGRNNTEEYDGTNWTSVNNMPAAVYGHGGSGEQTAVIMWSSPYCALYDGTNWTNTTSMTSARGSTSKQIGSGNNGVALGGDNSGLVNSTEEYEKIGLGDRTITTS